MFEEGEKMITNQFKIVTEVGVIDVEVFADGMIKVAETCKVPPDDAMKELVKVTLFLCHYCHLNEDRIKERTPVNPELESHREK